MDVQSKTDQVKDLALRGKDLQDFCKGTPNSNLFFTNDDTNFFKLPCSFFIHVLYIEEYVLEFQFFNL